jgi:hypothetical protein
LPEIDFSALVAKAAQLPLKESDIDAKIALVEMAMQALSLNRRIQGYVPGTGYILTWDADSGGSFGLFAVTPQGQRLRLTSAPIDMKAACVMAIPSLASELDAMLNEQIAALDGAVAALNGVLSLIGDVIQP